MSPHTTFYVQRPVREFVRAGEIVTSTAFAELEKTAMKRDNMIEMYQRKEIEASATLHAVIDRLAVLNQAVLAPVTGPVVQRRGTRGFEPDGWMLGEATLPLHCIGDVRGVEASFWAPAHEGPCELLLAVGSRRVAAPLLSDAVLTVKLALDIAAGSDVELTVRVTKNGAPAVLTDDTRPLACVPQLFRFVG